MNRQQEQPFTPFFEFDFESTCRDLFSAREAQLPLSLSQLCHSTEFTSDSLLSSTEDCKLPQAADLVAFCEELNGHCQSKFVYFAKTSKPDFAAIDFPEFLPVDLSGPLAAPSI
jgi:hypothetical protein